MSHLPSERLLIVNADDLGYSAAVNRGIAQAHALGIVTSASVMVRGEAADEVATIAQAHPRLGLGLHVDLGEWTVRAGEWVELYRVLDEQQMHSREAVAAEVERQLAMFEAMLRRSPIHLDSHQHVHRQEPVRSVLLDLGQRLGVPVRHFDPRVRYCGEFYGQAKAGEAHEEGILQANLVRVIRSLRPGVTELACHPAAGVDHASLYAGERLIELQSLVSPVVRSAVEEAGVRLISFADLRQ